MPITATYYPTTFWEAFLLSPVLGPALAVLILTPIVGMQLFKAKRTSSTAPKKTPRRQNEHPAGAAASGEGARTVVRGRAVGEPGPPAKDSDELARLIARTCDQLLIAAHMTEQLRRQLDQIQPANEHVDNQDQPH
ncbi:MAG: hypothetical protein H7288_22610 [Kineosporiaceae bacterium]|nr:hypothetical protein [Aeromicrobium sp.]